MYLFGSFYDFMNMNMFLMMWSFFFFFFLCFFFQWLSFISNKLCINKKKKATRLYLMKFNIFKFHSPSFTIWCLYKLQSYVQVDKSTIVNEAVNYIKTLEHTLETLQKQRIEKLQNGMIVEYEVPLLITSQTEELKLKEEFLANKESSKNFLMSTKTCQSCLIPPCFQTWSSPNVVLNLCGDDAQISVCSPRKPGLLATIFKILEKHKLNVVSAHISSDNCRSLYMIHAHVSERNLNSKPYWFNESKTFNRTIQI